MKIYRVSISGEYGGWMSPTGEVIIVPPFGHEKAGIGILKGLGEYDGLVYGVVPDLMLKGWIRFHLQGRFHVNFINSPTNAQRVRLLEYINEGYDYMYFYKLDVMSMREKCANFRDPISAREYVRGEM